MRNLESGLSLVLIEWKRINSMINMLKENTMRMMMKI